MRRMLWALAPLVLAAVWLYGWKSLAMVLVAAVVGWSVERLMLRQYREPVTQAVFVTTTILALSLPPTIPLWMVALGTLVAVLFGKMVFGGFGRNVFNPAMVGRAFLYVSFGQAMTGAWGEPLAGFLGNSPQAGQAAEEAANLFPARLQYMLFSAEGRVPGTGQHFLLMNGTLVSAQTAPVMRRGQY